MQGFDVCHVELFLRKSGRGSLWDLFFAVFEEVAPKLLTGSEVTMAGIYQVTRG